MQTPTSNRRSPGQAPIILSALAAILLLPGNAHAQSGWLQQREFNRPGKYSISQVRVAERPGGGAEAIITASYTYDGFGRPSLRITPIIEKTGQKASATWFEADGASIMNGRGSIAFKIRYSNDKPDAPQELVTDKVSLFIANPISKEAVGVLSFPIQIAWNRAASEDGTKAAAPSPTAASQPETKPAPRLEAKLQPSPERKIEPRRESKVEAKLEARHEAKLEPEPEAKPAPKPEARVTEAVERLTIPVPAPAPEEQIAAVGSFSALTPTGNAAWQDRFTLGPGDVLDLGLFGEPELSKKEIVIGPDGRISYLEAHDVLAAGSTVDELREKLDKELSKFRRAPRSIISPAAFHSKKYFILGRITQKGAFTLDRPMTIIEAVARARGLETTLADRNLVEVADLSRSILARRGQRVPVDFERLFMEGDLTQNVPLEPGDYLYFPPGNAREVYVLGEVKNPGPLSFASGATAVGAIARRGGFAEKAWKGKVLIVRGSLNRPEAFALDVSSVLNARAPDFELQPRDIVYVSSRPWAKVEELLDTAATAFIQSAVITWTGGNVGPLIK